MFLCVCGNAHAQFTRDRFGLGNNLNNLAGPPGSENNNSSQDTSNVKTDTLSGFSFKKMVRGYFGRDTLLPGYLLLGSALVPGASQAYNKQYWKIPLTYAGIASGLTVGIYAGNKYRQTGNNSYKIWSTVGYIGAGLVYWGQMMDGIVNFKTGPEARRPIPAKATIYSLLLPGLGQAYNGDYWKIPIWYGGLMTCAYFWHTNDMQYKRFKYITIVGNDPESGYVGSITPSQAEWYRDTYRRYRDYSILATVIVYALQVIDANVFAYMADFNVDNNIASIDVRPAVINPILPELKQSAEAGQMAALGLNFQLNF
ncbi:MAG: hypothetical protein KBS58_01640 [Bacteroidales bacterium]|nr:hypothetical protein [Candidatus Cacconaster equi]